MDGLALSSPSAQLRIHDARFLVTFSSFYFPTSPACALPAAEHHTTFSIFLVSSAWLHLGPLILAPVLSGPSQGHFDMIR